MRFAIALATTAVLAGPALADPGFDPFEHRAASPNPPVMSPSETAAAREAARTETEVVDPGKPRRTTAKIFLATGVALGAGSLLVSIYERHEYDQALSRPTGAPLDASSVAAANHAHDVARYVATPMFAAGLVGVGVATYLYITAPKELVRRPMLVPSAGGDQAGVSLVGAF